MAWPPRPTCASCARANVLTRVLHAALWCAWKAFGAHHLVPGSDWPVLLAHESYRQTMHWIEGAGLPAEDVADILDQSGPALLGPASPLARQSGRP